MPSAAPRKRHVSEPSCHPKNRQQVEFRRPNRREKRRQQARQASQAAARGGRGGGGYAGVLVGAAHGLVGGRFVAARAHLGKGHATHSDPPPTHSCAQNARRERAGAHVVAGLRRAWHLPLPRRRRPHRRRARHHHRCARRGASRVAVDARRPRAAADGLARGLVLPCKTQPRSERPGACKLPTRGAGGAYGAAGAGRDRIDLLAVAGAALARGDDVPRRRHLRHHIRRAHLQAQRAQAWSETYLTAAVHKGPEPGSEPGQQVAVAGGGRTAPARALA